MFVRRIAVGTGIVAAAAALSLAMAGSVGAATPAASTAAHGSQVNDVQVWRPYTAIVVNQSNQPLTIVWMATDRGANTAVWKGVGPSVGTVIQPGDQIRVDWLVYFTGSQVDISYQAPDGSVIVTETSMSFLGGGQYSCYGATGSLRCASNNPDPSLEQNVVIA